MNTEEPHLSSILNTHTAHTPHTHRTHTPPAVRYALHGVQNYRLYRQRNLERRVRSTFGGGRSAKLQRLFLLPGRTLLLLFVVLLFLQATPLHSPPLLLSLCVPYYTCPNTTTPLPSAKVGNSVTDRSIVPVVGMVCLGIALTATLLSALRFRGVQSLKTDPVDRHIAMKVLRQRLLIHEVYV